MERKVYVPLNISLFKYIGHYDDIENYVATMSLEVAFVYGGSGEVGGITCRDYNGSLEFSYRTLAFPFVHSIHYQLDNHGHPKVDQTCKTFPELNF